MKPSFDETMIVIVNVSKGSPVHCSYELRINSRVIAKFKHKKEDGLAKCLQLAAEAAERVRLEQLGGSIMKSGTVLDSEDICGFCGEPGADKIPHPVRWPGEESAGTKLVHSECEDNECKRAHALLSDKQRADFLNGI